MNQFVYVPVPDSLPLSTEMVVNPISRLDQNYTPVKLQFYFTAGGILIHTAVLEIPFVNQRACDLVGECLSFSPMFAACISMCEFPYAKDNVIWFDLAVELTKAPLSSVDMANLFNAYFNNKPGAITLANMRQMEK